MFVVVNDIKWTEYTVVGRDVKVNVPVVLSLIGALGMAVDAVRQETKQSDKWKKACSLVCNLGRQLIRSVILSPTDFCWSTEMASDSIRYLLDAVDVTRESKHYPNLARRPEAFEEALDIFKNGQRAYTDLQSAAQV